MPLTEHWYEHIGVNASWCVGTLVFETPSLAAIHDLDQLHAKVRRRVQVLTSVSNHCIVQWESHNFIDKLL